MSILRLLVWLGLLIYAILDPIILSDDEFVSAESETDYTNLDVDLIAESDSYSLHVADSKSADGNSFGLGTTLISHRPVANYQDDSNDNNNSVIDSTKRQLAADRLRSASPNHRSVTHQASSLQVNTEITQGSASYVDLDVAKRAEDKGIDIFVKGDNNNNTCFIKRSRSSAVSHNNLACDSNVSISK